MHLMSVDHLKVLVVMFTCSSLKSCYMSNFTQFDCQQIFCQGLLTKI